MLHEQSNKFCKRFFCVWIVYFWICLFCLIEGLALYFLVSGIIDFESTNTKISDLVYRQILSLPCYQICDDFYSKEYLQTQCCVDAFLHDDCEDKKTCGDIKLTQYETDLANQYDQMFLAGAIIIGSFIIIVILIIKRKQDQRRWNAQDREQRRLLRQKLMNQRADRIQTYDLLQSFKLSDKENSCAICYEAFNQKKAVKLNCQHMYHRQCIKDWMAIKDTCPICRSPNHILE